MVISSHTNATVRRVRRLRKRAWRERKGSVLLEGRRTVLTALGAGVSLQDVFHTGAEGRDDELLATAKAAGARIHAITADVMGHLTDAQKAPGVLAVGPLRASTLSTVAGGSAVVLDGIKDPATLGGVIATAAAAGVPAVVVADGCADVFTPKVLRAAGGAHFLLNVVRDVAVTEAIMGLGVPGARAIALSPEGKPPWETDLRGRMVLLVRGETNGRPSPSAEMEHVTVAGDPTPPLTASVAVVLYEWVRQGGDGR